MNGIRSREGNMMKELLTVVTRKGQITVPAEIRRTLGIREGDKLAVSVAEDVRQVRLRLVRSVAELTFGALTPAGPARDVPEQRRAFEEAAADEVVAETEPTEPDRA
jgi:AbrB family looped-hinge helix DNA binding protein